MNYQQQRLLQSMIDLIQSYLDGQTEDLNLILGNLEGMLDASEIKDMVFVRRWYDFWTPLETRRAMQGNHVAKDKANEELTAMKNFLLSQSTR